MSDLIETSEFTAGIYQIETNDDVLGGENGIANAQAKALANRTKWLKNQLNLKALKNGSAANPFKVKAAIANDEAVNKKQMENLFNQVPTVPTGLVVANPSTIIPTGFLECNGAVLSRTTYADLFAVIGTTYGHTNSSNFKLPDLRGEFIRGFDNGRGVDNSRVIGSFQADEFKSHRHLFADGGGSTGGPFLAAGAVNYSAGLNDNTSSVGGEETRPRNVAMMYCIKY